MGIRLRYWVVGALALAAAAFAGFRTMKTTAPETEFKSIFVGRGALRLSVEAGGTVEPENRVEILPPVAGRVEDVLVDQGHRVKKGQTLAWMSSTDRAAVLDAALAQGPTVFARWEAAYRPTPILSPVEGLIIERRVVEGQTVGSASPIFVMADRLVVRARVDESDIARIRPDQEARVTADALPGKPFDAKVRKIDFQSKDVGGVTAYQVELEPKSLPAELRSGMTARVDFIVRVATDAVLLPVSALQGVSDSSIEVQVRKSGVPVKTTVRLGASDGSNVEVLEGLAAGDEVLVPAPDYGSKPASNPLSPSRRPSSRSGSGGGGNRGGSRGGYH